MTYKRAYVEITNRCNMKCSFCIGTKRPPRFMTPAEFEKIAREVRPFTEYLYLHVMGEPLLHPDLAAVLSVAGQYGFRVNITTNGTLLEKQADVLLGAGCLRKVSVSLHSFEGNGRTEGLFDYLHSVLSFAGKAPCLTELRLWNEGGANRENALIYGMLNEALGTDVLSLPAVNGSRKIGERLYISSAEKFDWPSLGAAERNTQHCYGLKTQFGILCDGTVVPCCLDSEGSVALGNVFDTPLADILASPRAAALRESFRCGAPSEELCRRCGYATRFTK